MTAPTVADLRRETASAAAEAVGTLAGDGTEAAEAATEAAVVEGAAPVASTEDGTTVAPEGATVETETPAPAAGTVEALSEYFGLDLSGIPVEQSSSIVEELKKRDDFIGKLLRKESEAPGVSTEVKDEKPPELTDEDILKALGLDPTNNPFDEQVARVTVPLVRKQVAQDAALASLIENQELMEIDKTWRAALSGMEKEFGSLPKEIDADAVMEFAAKEGIANPMDAYWRIVGPGRALLSAAMKGVSEKEATAAKKQAATTRPNSSSAENEAPLESKTVKGATREAAERVLKQLGVDF